MQITVTLRAIFETVRELRVERSRSNCASRNIRICVKTFISTNRFLSYDFSVRRIRNLCVIFYMLACVSRVSTYIRICDYTTISHMGCVKRVCDDFRTSVVAAFGRLKRRIQLSSRLFSTRHYTRQYVGVRPKPGSLNVFRRILRVRTPSKESRGFLKFLKTCSTRIAMRF